METQATQNWWPRHIALTLTVALGLLLFGIWPPGAFANPTRDGWGFGIADDGAAGILDGSGFRQLQTKIFRFQVAYNAADPLLDSHDRQLELQRATDKIAAARRAGVQSIMVTFGHKLHEDGPTFTQPDPSTWARGVYAFIDAFDADVDMWGVANEPNHKWLKNAPCLLAQYSQVLHQALASRGGVDHLVSPEWLDDANVHDYIDQYAWCGGDFGQIIGWHPYGGVEHRSAASTLDLLAHPQIPSHLPVFITEVGSRLRENATCSYHSSLAQQEEDVRWLVENLANEHPRIQRVYYYQQRPPPPEACTWDSGLEDSNSNQRPAWYKYCSAIYEGRTCSPPIPPVPPGGTFVRTPDGSVYRIAGGTPVHVFTCSSQGYYPGCPTPSIYNVPTAWVAEWTAREPFPRDGTFLWHPNGAVFRVAGGALVYLSTCAAQGYFPGCSNLIALDGIAINGLINAQALPRNGVLVRAPDGSVYRMECGDALYVSDCVNVGGCSGLIDLDGLAINRLVAAAGCDDGKPCTTDRCENLVECRHEFAAQCMAPILSLLLDDDCGNGVTDPGESCDDGNTTPGDGCNATCQLEACFSCTGTPSMCTPITTCNDGDGCCLASCADQDDDCSARSPIAGKKLLITDPPASSRRSITFYASDPSIDTGAINPIADGAHLQVYNPDTGEAACLSLPNTSGAWRAVGSPSRVTFRYRDPKYANGPCNVATIRRGQITVRCRTSSKPISYTLDEPQQHRVGISLKSGERTFCALFGGSVTRDSGASSSNRGRGVFAAKNAPAPGVCPTAPPCS
jgi:cysteine-rich repeat protein